MKSIPVAQQFRRSTGEFLNKQDKLYISQTQQDEKVKILAAYPGRYRGNAARQDLANATLHLISLLSTLQPGQSYLAIQNSQNNARFNTALLNNNTTSNSLEAQIKSVTPYGLLPEVSGTVNYNPLISGPESDAPPQTLPRLRRSAPLSPRSESAERAIAPTAAPNNSYHFTSQQIAEINHNVQNQLLDKLLDKHHPPVTARSALTRVNELVEYIKGNEEERIDEIARLLLSASAAYGENKDEYLSIGQKHAIIAQYLNQAILGKSLDSWCLQQAHLMRQEDNALYNHANLQNRLTRIINGHSKEQSLSAQARIFYQDNILKKVLPTIMLTPVKKDKEELETLNVNDPRWAFIYAGAMLLSSSGAEFMTLPLQELEELGTTLDLLLRKGAVPQEYIEFFKMPALFHYAYQYPSTMEEALNSPKKLTQIFNYFFENTAAWVKVNNPFALLPDLVNNWKTRSELAGAMLAKNNISEDLLSHYLNSHNDLRLPVKDGFERIALPNIDHVFYQQNRKIETAANKADKLLLPVVFNSLSDEDQIFIQNAKIDRVTAVLDARDEIRGVPMHTSARRGIDRSGALIYSVPDHIDLLSCTNGHTEKIYALRTMRNGEYILERVDRKREAIIDLLDDGFVPSVDKDYKLRITSHMTLKERHESANVFIDNLANLHSKNLRNSLDDRGYDKTTKDKVGDFFLNIIPFYTCISQSIKGNVEKAVPACISDVLGLLPLAGLAAKTGLRFGTALSRATAGALAYGLRENTINGIFRQAGNKLMSQFPQIAREISPEVMQNLGVALLRYLDPGVELLSRVGIKGITVLKSIASAAKKDKGLSLLATSLDNLQAPEAKIEAHQISTIFSPQDGKMLEVVKAGTFKGKPVWAQFNHNTGQFYQQKYCIEPDGNLGYLDSPFLKELERLKKMPLEVGINFMDPAEAGPSGSRDKSVWSKATARPLKLPLYNQLPPLAGNSEKFTRVRAIFSSPYPPSPSAITNTQIQRLTHFIPPAPLYAIAPEYVNQLFVSFNDDVFNWHPWRAYTGFTPDVPPFIASIQPKIRNNLLRSRYMLEKAHQLMATINYHTIMEHRVGKYLAGMLGTERVEVVIESAQKLSQIINNCKNLFKASEEADFSNFIILSTDLVKSPDDPTKYMSLLTDEEILHMPFGATSIPDAEGRIFLYADAFLSRNGVLQKDNLAVSSKTKVTMAETIIHELSHSSSGTLDLFKVNIDTKRQKINGLELRASFIQQLYRREEGSFFPAFFNNNDVYLFFSHLKKHQGIDIPISEQAIVNAIMSDKMLFANLMMTDADVIARTITALVEKRPFDAKYRNKRNAETITEASDINSEVRELAEYVGEMLTILIAQVMGGVTKQNRHSAVPLTKPHSPGKIKNIKINGVTMSIQLYGSETDEYLLFPEMNEFIPVNKPLDAKTYKRAFSTLLPRQKKALKIWTAKGLQHTQSYHDDTPGLIGGVNPELNKKLLKGIPLMKKDQNLIKNILSAISARKIPMPQGSYVRGSAYINGTHNPWLEDAIEVNDYVTASPAFMSVSSDPVQLLDTIVDTSNIDNHIDSLIFFKIANASNAVPLLSVAPPNSLLKSDFIYPPGALFKVESLVYASPISSEAAYANQEMYLPDRVAVVLTEVDEAEAKEVVMAKNMFTGQKLIL